jgi:uncharacterized protein YndB with AHSA1/START domain
MEPLAKTETACFLIADLSGYTSYLAGVELDHAQDIIADILDNIVRALRPPFRLAKFEGDAAFVYAVTEKIDGSLLQDAVEGAYFVFRRRKRNIEKVSVCTCNACRAMKSLDLKFVTHHGEMVKQKIGGREELAGRDVIAVHRLLKNSVEEKLGGRAYALYTDPCVTAMGIDPVAHGLTEHSETIDILGDVKVWVRDLEDAWAEETERKRVLIMPEESALVLGYDVPAPRPVVWEYFTLPEHRPKWQGSSGLIEKSATGRRGVGTKNHCLHGDFANIEDILDWRPFDYLTLTAELGAFGPPAMLISYLFTEKPDGGTRVEFCFAKPKPKERKIFEEREAGLREFYTWAMANLNTVLAGETATAALIEEPALLPMQERFLTQPVRGPG